MEWCQSSVTPSSFLSFGLTLSVLSYTAVSLYSRCVFRHLMQHDAHSHPSDVRHVYRRAAAIPSGVLHVLQSELALCQLLRFALRCVPNSDFNQVRSRLICITGIFLFVGFRF